MVGNRRRGGGGGKGGGGQGEDLPLHTAARTGDMVAVRSLCNSNPLAVNARDRHSRTPLHLAAWSGQTEVVSYLCKNKADVGASAMDDMGAIHFASQKGHLEVVRILLSSGVSLKAANRKGWTPLHFAVRGSHLELVRYLVRKGASLSAKTKSGETPTDLADSDEVRAVVAECERLSKEELAAVGKSAGKRASASQGKAEDAPETVAGRGNDAHDSGVGDATPAAPDVGEEDQRDKRNARGAGAEDEASRSKKPRVALGHLLAEDDMEEQAE